LLMATAQELQDLLLQLTQNDTETVKNATEKLTQFLSTPGALEPFCVQITQAPNATARQLAAILLRAEMKKLWGECDKNMKESISKLLLERFVVGEGDSKVRKALGALVIAIVKLEPTWEDAYAKVFEMAGNSQDQARRTVAYTVLRNLAGCQFHGSKYLPPLMELFMGGLQDGGGILEIRLESLKGVGVLSNYVEDEDTSAFVDLVPNMLEVVRAALESGDEVSVSSAIAVFQDLTDSKAEIFGTHGLPTCKFMIELTATQAVPAETRKMSAAFLAWFIRFQKNIVVKNDLVNALLQLSFNLSIEDDTVEEEDSVLLKAAAEILDSLFLELPTLTYEPAVSASLELFKAPEPHKRRAAIMTLMLLAEGCCEQVIENENSLHELVKIVCSAMKDQDNGTRRHACLAMMQFASHFDTEITGLCQQILEALISMLQKPQETTEVKEVAWKAVEGMVEAADEETIAKILAPMMGVLVDAIKVESTKVQKTIVAVFSTLATIAKEKFLPYYDISMQFLEVLLNAKIDPNDEDMVELRGEVTESMGHIMNSVGVENNNLDTVVQITQKVMDSMVETSDLRPYTLNYAATLMELYKADFEKFPFYKQVTKEITDTLLADDNMKILHDDDNLGPSAVNLGFGENKANEFNLATHGYGENGSDEFNVMLDLTMGLGSAKIQLSHTSMMAKASALNAASALAEHVPMQYKLLDLIFKHVALSVEYPHENVRIAALSACHECAMAAIRMYPAPEWEQGVVNTIHDDVIAIVEELFTIYLTVMKEDDTQDCVAMALENMRTEIETLGPGSCCIGIDGMAKPEEKGMFMNLIMEAVTLLLNEDADCQQCQPDEVIVEQGHKILTDSIFEFINSLATVWGSVFEPEFQKIYPLLFKFQSPKRHKHDRSISIGSLGDVISSFTPDLAKNYLPKAFEAALSYVNDSDPIIRQNSVFCLGALMIGGAEHSLPWHQKSLEVLVPLLTVPRGSSKMQVYVRDNAASAIFKLLRHGHSELSPEVLEELFTRLVTCLPLEKDFEENCHVYSTLAVLLEAAFQQRLKLSDGMIIQCLRAIAWACSPQAKAEITEKTRKDLQPFVSKYRQQIEQAATA